MQLNQTTLRGILAQILSVNEKYVVPKQGNWWNPQQPGANIANWCAYRIKSNRPRTAPFYVETTKSTQGALPENSVCVLKLASVELQFVGPDSEQLAQSVAMWPMRGDVRAQLKNVNGSIMYEDFTAIPSDFYQEGNNTVLAWNVPDVKILWYDVLATNQQPLKTIEMGGHINV
ncbi:MAG: hypothetical protein IKY09_02785 [Methanocorpusculum sp.]|nr:hypothetical protein [Methanocorpusculum sp.]MBR5450176.1 hypothetical protein [Methanocorpusculum sp.]